MKVKKNINDNKIKPTHSLRCSFVYRSDHKLLNPPQTYIVIAALLESK
jgi:hypothetical protein